MRILRSGVGQNCLTLYNPIIWELTKTQTTQPIHIDMLNKKRYLAPDVDFEPMSLQTMLCGSEMDGGTEDYDVINDFVW